VPSEAPAEGGQLPGLPTAVGSSHTVQTLAANSVVTSHLGKLMCSPVGDPAQSFLLPFCDYVHPLARLLLARESFAPPKYEH